MFKVSVENEIVITEQYKKLLQNGIPPYWRNLLDPNRAGYDKKEATKISRVVLKNACHSVDLSLDNEDTEEFNEILLRKMSRLLEETMTAENS